MHLCKDSTPCFIRGGIIMTKTQKYRRTKKGLTANIYSNQLASSLTHSFKTPNYSLLELREWIYNQDNFNDLFNLWVESNYDKDSIPSVDRLEDDKGYSLDNIQLITWKENNKKARLDIRNNKLKHNCLFNGGHKAVVQYTLDDKKINTFISVAEASRALNINHQAISRVCRGERTKTKGFRFKYDN